MSAELGLVPAFDGPPAHLSQRHKAEAFERIEVNLLATLGRDEHPHLAIVLSFVHSTLPHRSPALANIRWAEVERLLIAAPRSHNVETACATTVRNPASITLIPSPQMLTACLLSR